MGQGPFEGLVPCLPRLPPSSANFVSCVMLLGGRLWPPKVGRSDGWNLDGHCAPSIYTKDERLVCPFDRPSLSIRSSRLSTAGNCGEKQIWHCNPD